MVKFMDLEAHKQLEPGREMGWVTLGHTFFCGPIIISRVKPGICC